MKSTASESSLNDQKQRVVVDRVTTKYVDINRRLPQGTVLGPILFSMMVNDITAANPSSNCLMKYTDHIALNVPVRSGAVDQLQQRLITSNAGLQGRL